MPCVDVEKLWGIVVMREQEDEAVGAYLRVARHRSIYYRLCIANFNTTAVLFWLRSLVPPPRFSAHAVLVEVVGRWHSDLALVVEQGIPVNARVCPARSERQVLELRSFLAAAGRSSHASRLCRRTRVATSWSRRSVLFARRQVHHVVGPDVVRGAALACRLGRVLADLQAPDDQDALTLREPLDVFGLRAHRPRPKPVRAFDVLAVGSAAARIDGHVDRGLRHAGAGESLLWIRSQISDDLNAQHGENSWPLLAITTHG